MYRLQQYLRNKESASVPTPPFLVSSAPDEPMSRFFFIHYAKNLLVFLYLFIYIKIRVVMEHMLLTKTIALQCIVSVCVAGMDDDEELEKAMLSISPTKELVQCCKYRRSTE